MAVSSRLQLDTSINDEIGSVASPFPKVNAMRESDSEGDKGKKAWLSSRTGLLKKNSLRSFFEKIKIEECEEKNR
jgi:hypothetical protein